MGLRRNDWIAFASVWLAGMSCLGAGLLIAPLFLPAQSDWVSTGSNTALLLVAASILFVVVLDPFTNARHEPPIRLAGILTAVFGYIGTVRALGAENSLLLAVIIMVTFYVAWMGAAFVLAIRLLRRAFRRRRY